MTRPITRPTSGSWCWTPLHFLADLRRMEEPDLIPLAKLLVARGADRKAKIADGMTAADLAAKRGFAKLAAALR